MKYLLGIDFGGGSTKATLINTDGVIIAENMVEYPTYYPENGYCEQSAQDWITALGENSRGLISKSGINAADILAVAIDSATHTWLMCDENAKPIRNAIHWTDCRSRAQATYLFENHGDLIYKLSFHKPDTIWTLPQMMWIKEHEAENFERMKYVFFEKDYIRYFLTDVYCTDYIEAEGSMLFDCNTLTWSKELCDLAGVNPEIMPPIVKPTDVIGKITAEAAEFTSLAEGTPVICGTTDTCMEVFASGAVEQGDVTVKLATAGRICVITDRPYPHRHLVNYSHIADGLWYPGTATKAAASSYRWYRDTFGGDYKDLDRGAMEVPIGCEGLIYHPYINGELTPYADPMLCGSFTGMRATHTRSHFTRAVLEGVSFSLLHSKKTLDEIGIPYNSVGTIIGGGAKGPLWKQITADALSMTLRVTESSDSSLGSAMLAGLAVGVFATPREAVNKCIKEVSITRPIPENTEKYQKLFEEYVRIHDALAPIYDAR